MAIVAATFSPQLVQAQEVLQPTTVLGVRAVHGHDDSVHFKTLDQLHHDGGAVLQQSAAISGIRKAGNYGVDPVFRGFKYNQLNVVLDGALSANAACPNRMDPPTSQMVASTIERVEVFKGPYALRHGVGMGATINFVTSRPTFSNRSDWSGRISSGYQSNGNSLHNEASVQWRNKNINMMVFGSLAEGQDYSTGKMADGTRMSVPADFQRNTLGMRMNVKLTPQNVVTLNYNRNIAEDVDFPAANMDLRSDVTELLRLDHLYTNARSGAFKSLKQSFFGSYVDHTMDNLTKMMDPRMVNAIADAETWNAGYRSEARIMSGNNTILTGVDMRQAHAQGSRSREFLMGPMAGMTKVDDIWQGGTLDQVGQFSEWKRSGQAVDLIISNRIDWVRGYAQTPIESFTTMYGDLSRTDLNVSASLGLVQKQHNIKHALWIGSGQRSASLLERYVNKLTVGNDPYEMLGNPDLAPERNNQVDWISTYHNNGMMIKVNVYASYLNNAITSVIDPDVMPAMMTSPGVRRYTNIDRAMRTGYEITYHQELTDHMHLHTELAYTYGQDLERQEALPEIAPLELRSHLQGDFLGNRLKTRFTLRHVAAQDRVSVEYGELATPAFTLMNFQADWKIMPQASLTMGVNNIMDVAYYEHLSRTNKMNSLPIYEPGRNFSLALRIKWP